MIVQPVLIAVNAKGIRLHMLECRPMHLTDLHPVVDRYLADTMLVHPSTARVLITLILPEDVPVTRPTTG